MKKLLTFFLSALFVVQAQAETIRFGVNAPRSVAETQKQWQELGKYLTQATGQTVEIVPLEVAKVFGAASGKQVDFILANPNQALMLKHKLGGDLLASMKSKSGSMFAGVIVTKKGAGINKLEDLKGKQVSALNLQSAGGYLFQVYHMTQKGMQLRRDYGIVSTTSQDDSVLAVLDGKVSAAFVRTGVLENMAAEGKIKLADLTVLDEHKDPSFTLLRTTELYPEWYVVALKNANPQLVPQIKAALLKLSGDMPAAQAAGIKGFQDPLPSTSLENMMKSLKAPPFE